MLFVFLCSAGQVEQSLTSLRLQDAEESARQELYYSTSCCSPHGRQRGLGGEQDNKIKDLWQLFTSRTSNHRVDFFLASVTLFLPKAQKLMYVSVGNLKFIPQWLQNAAFILEGYDFGG